jgi:hypothetical protein
MATYYSEHFQPTQAGAVTSAATDHRASAAVAGRLRTKIATFKNVTFATADVVKLFRVKSNDAILELKIVNADGGTDVPGTLGLQKADGTVVDADFFLADIVFETARAQAAGGDLILMNVGGVVGDTTLTIGLPVWQQLGLTADPHLTYEVVAVIGTVVAGDAMSFFVRMDYLAAS